MGIRLQCPNGHKVHVKAFLAGKRAVCPQCGARFQIPPEIGAAGDDATGDEIATVPGNGEESIAGHEQEVLAPTPQPVPVAKAKVADKPAGHSGAVDPAPIDLDALASAGGTSLLGGPAFGHPAFGPGAKRLADRRKHAQKMRVITLALVVAVTLLTCVLMFLVLRRAF
jgi:hypothetical protein